MFQQFAQATKQQYFSVMITVLRISFGYIFLMSGITKLMNGWALEDLNFIGDSLIAHDWMMSLVGNQLVAHLNIWPQIFVGIALILGVMVRPAGIIAFLLNTAYYIGTYYFNVPVQGIVTYNAIYAMLGLLLASGGIGHIWGLDGVIYRKLGRPSALHKFLFK